MDCIRDYNLSCNFTSENAGSCVWAFASRCGREYFIKRFTHVKYPPKDTKLSPVTAERKRAAANAFYKTQKRFYEALSSCHSGNNIIPLAFFREGSFYYAVSDRVYESFADPALLSSRSEAVKRCFIKTLLYSVKCFHAKGIVHSDLKPNNILIKETSMGYCCPKIIDFEGGFLEGAMPDEITGDQIYLSPEALEIMSGKKQLLNRKTDVFALGLLIHQYWTGSLPDIIAPESNGGFLYACEALLSGGRIRLGKGLPGVLSKLLPRMLEPDPGNRISVDDAWKILYDAWDDDRDFPVRRRSESKGSTSFYTPAGMG